MPGIVGLITNKPRHLAEQQLRTMVAALCHDSSYQSHTWIEESVGIYVGWVTRKSRLADSFPVRNERGNLRLVFAGEEYPEPGTSLRLKNLGHHLESEYDYLVHLAEEDPEYPKNLNGRFQGVLTNIDDKTVTVFNDRYGLQRFYYHESSDCFYFGAEAKAILAVRPELRVPNYQSFGELVSCGCVLENQTLFAGIHVLPPASAWNFREGSLLRKNRYFKPQEWEDQANLTPEEYYRRLRATFSQKLPRYFCGTERIGMSLTGGLDTRMIMAWHKAKPGDLPCYSFGGMFRDCEDVSLAKRVAEACGQPFQVIPVGTEFLAQFSAYAERAIYLTDGCVSVNRASDLFANERAAEIAPVRMTGNYGSEVLRRVPAFKPTKPSADLYNPEFQSWIEEANSTYSKLIQSHALSFIAFCQMPWHHYGLLALEQTQVTVRSPYLDNDIARTAFCAPESSKAKTDVFQNNTDCVRLIADGNPELAALRTDRGLGGSSQNLTSALKRNFLEFTFKAEYAFDYGMPQWLAKIDHSLSALRLERLFLGRHKFNHYRVWYRDALSEYVRQILLDSRTLARTYLQRSGVETIVRGHLKGDRNYTTEIHQLLTLELIHRLFLDSN